MHVLRATPLDVLWNVSLPRTLPFLFASLKGAITLAFVGHGISPESRHGETHTPIIFTRTRRRLLKDVGAEVDDNRDLRGPQEFRNGYANAFECAGEIRHGRRYQFADY